MIFLDQWTKTMGASWQDGRISGNYASQGARFSGEYGLFAGLLEPANGRTPLWRRQRTDGFVSMKSENFALNNS